MRGGWEYDRSAQRNRFYSPGLLHKLIDMSEKGNSTTVILHTSPILNLFNATRLKESKVNIHVLFQQIVCYGMYTI